MQLSKEARALWLSMSASFGRLFMSNYKSENRELAKPSIQLIMNVCKEQSLKVIFKYAFDKKSFE